MARLPSAGRSRSDEAVALREPQRPNSFAFPTPLRTRMVTGMFDHPDLNGAAHVVQLALTPIFLLTGLASLLNVFTTRLGRVADRVDRLADAADRHPRQLRRLRLRSRSLDAAVLLAALAGAATCCAAMTLFLGALRNAATGTLLFTFFGVALACAVLALGAFAFETILSGRSVREQAQPDGDRQETRPS